MNKSICIICNSRINLYIGIKNKFMKKLLYFLFLFFGLVASVAITPEPAIADASCTPIYGGGTDCPPEQSLLLDKTVQNPGNGAFVDNVQLFDYAFLADQSVVYRLRIENTSNTQLTNIVVTDVLPENLRFIAGPGTYDQTNNTLTFTIAVLNAGSSRTFDVHAKVASIAELPTDQSTFCRSNSATAKSGNASDSDTAQICIEKKVLDTPALPTTGPGANMLLALGLIGVFIAGQRLALKKIN